MSATTDALAYYRDLAKLSKQASTLVLRLWRGIDRGDISRSWLALLPDVAAVVVAAQTVAAELADPYLQQRVGDGRRVNPVGFAGETPGGGSLESLLYLPTIDAKERIAAGASAGGALRQAQPALLRYVGTTVADAGRLSVSAGMAARPHAVGFYRMLQPPSCGRCAILAGKYFRYNRGFQRHPHCFPSGTVVSGPSADGATRRWYEGELVVIRTAGGKNLAVTGNHPILTSQGWLPANLLREGGDVVSRASGDRSGALLVPDHDQMPARIEDLWRSDGMTALGRMPVSAEDFHGDGLGSSHVDVVLADRLLWDREQVSLLQELGQEQLAIGPELAVSLPCSGARAQLGLGNLASLRGLLRRRSLGGALDFGHLPGADEPGLAWSANGYVGVDEALADHRAADPEALRQGVLALARKVGGNDRGAVDVAVTSRWDAPPSPFSVESRVAYASRGGDLHFRLAGKVEVDRVVEVRRVEWSGHVYNLTSREGWYDANGIIVSNCDCVHIPVQEADDSLLFDARKAIEAGKVTGLSRADTRAILEFGADPAQVVNAKSGMYTAGGRAFTTTGTTRQGIAGARILARDVQRHLHGVGAVEGETFRNYTFDRQKANQYVELFRKGKTYTRTTRGGRTQSYAYRFARSARPTPEQILADARSRDEAVRLLINNGYIL